jgi:hypothetical protein
MIFSKFIIIIAVVYVTYYAINIMIDLIKSKAGSSAHEEGDIQFDLVGEELFPKKASLDADDNPFPEPDGGQKQEFDNQREETFSEGYGDRYYGSLGVDLRLEDVLPQEVNRDTERLRKINHHH